MEVFNVKFVICVHTKQMYITDSKFINKQIE